MLRFTKMNGAGNDFIVADNLDLSLALDATQIARLCDRHRGIGADGLLLVEPPQQGGMFRMRYYNADGGEAEMCGNGARCFARFAQRLSGHAGNLSIETLAGIIHARFDDTLVTIEMSDPTGLETNLPLSVSGENLLCHSINTGVPHAVILTENLNKIDIRTLGRAIRFHPQFAPKGTNVNFVTQLFPSHISIRTYERGVEDETLACGTGVCAAALIYSHLTGFTPPIQVAVRGGDTLQVTFEGTAGHYRKVLLTGPADFVFEGTAPV